MAWHAVPDHFVDDGTSHDVLLSTAREIAEELTGKPATVVVQLLPKVHAMVIAEAQRIFKEQHIWIYITGSPLGAQKWSSSFSQLVVLYHRIFQAKVQELFEQLQSYTKAIAHPNATVEEIERWVKDKQQLEMEQETLVADCVLYAATITYFVAFPWPSAQHLVSNCRALCEQNHLIPGHVDRYSLARCLGRGSAAWTSPHVELLSQLKLPCRDAYSRDLAVATDALAGPHSERWPLILDPTGIALHWMTVTESIHGCVVISVKQDPLLFLSELLEAAKKGIAIIVTGIQDSIPSHVFPLLNRRHLRTYHQVTLPFPVPVAGGETSTVELPRPFRLFFVSDAHDPSAFPPLLFSLINPVLFIPSVPMVTAALLPAIMERDHPSAAEDLQRLLSEVALYTTLVADADAHCRTSLDEPPILKTSRSQLLYLSNQLEHANQLISSSDETRKAYIQPAEVAAQLFMVLYNSSKCRTLQDFLEVLQAAVVQREASTSVEDGEELAVCLAVLHQSISEALVKAFVSEDVLAAALAMPVTPSSEEDHKVEGTPTLREALALWHHPPAIHKTASMSEADVAALLSLFPLTESSEAELLSPAVVRVIQAQVQLMQKRPTAVNEFLELKETIKQMEQRLPFYINSMKQVHARLCISLARNPVGLGPERNQEALQVAKLATTLSTARREIDLYIQEVTPTMMQQLHTAAVHLTEMIDETKEKMGKEGTESALVTIHEFKSRVDELAAQAEAIAGKANILHPLSAAILLCRCRSDELSDTFASLL